MADEKDVVPVVPVAPPNVPEFPPPVIRTTTEWKTLSDEWKNALQKITTTVDQLNKNTDALEREKRIIREAILTGKFDKVNRLKALEYAKLWERGIQFIPTYPVDWVPLRNSDSAPNNHTDATTFQGLFYDPTEEFNVKRQWIHAAPPSLMSTKSIASLFENGQSFFPPYDSEAIAGWRVMAARKRNEEHSLVEQQQQPIIVRQTPWIRQELPSSTSQPQPSVRQIMQQTQNYLQELKPIDFVASGPLEPVGVAEINRETEKEYKYRVPVHNSFPVDKIYDSSYQLANNNNNQIDIGPPSSQTQRIFSSQEIPGAGY